ncbi:MAG TPA: iron chelate uptake ABC transporter family permease subunit, partial [Paralcaligenes sp.]
MGITGESRKFAPRPVLIILACSVALAAVAASASGAVNIPWSRFPQLLWRGADSGDMALHNVLFQIRLPRVLFSMVTGAALAATGVAMQALFRNPLAEPGLVGISSGAALGAVCAITMAASSFFAVAGAAFLGGLLSTFIAYSVGCRHRGVAGLLLAGVAINAI